MANAQENPSVGEDHDAPPHMQEQESPSLSHALELKNQQDYWRWIQLQILRERVGGGLSRE